jgi:hypothetical protein
MPENISPVAIIPALLPPLNRIFGSISEGRIRKLLFSYALLLIAGTALFIFCRAEFWRVFGLGLLVPGGGFYASIDLNSANGISPIFAFLLALALFGVSLGVWFGTGNILAPPALWLALAIVAASLHSGGVGDEAISFVYVFVGLVFLAVIIFLRLRFARALKQRRLDNAYLLTQQDQFSIIFNALAAEEKPGMTLEDLQRLRFALDRALQPLAEFNGFEWLDQFQTAAVRYQLNFLAYGIALNQARFTPAFGGYQHQAQINLLDKQAEHKIWSYWALENLWGNCQYNPDPVRRENIMYTGFVALQMALFAASTGRDDFKQAGRFKLSHPSGASYAYNDEDLIGRLLAEYQASDFFLMACEPNWIYPLCNTIGACAILANDTQSGQNQWAEQQQNFRQHLENEFLDIFGRYVPCRSARTGLALPAFGGAMPLAMPCFFLNALFPELALRQWLLLRRRLFDGQGRFRREAFWRIDTGNYGFSRASAYTATALAAAELADQAVYDHCLLALEEECPSEEMAGVIHRQHASVWAHGVELMARAGGKHRFRDLLLQTKPNPGPRLDGIRYPEILVAAAYHYRDGLKAVLYPGHKNGVYDLALSGLKPLTNYVVNRQDYRIMADQHGEGRLQFPLNGRTIFEIFPESRV